MLKIYNNNSAPYEKDIVTLLTIPGWWGFRIRVILLVIFFFPRFNQCTGAARTTAHGTMGFARKKSDKKKKKMLKFDYRIVTIWWFFFSLITRFRRPDGLIYYYNDLGFFAQSWFTFTYYIGIPPYKFRIKSPSPRHRKHRADVLSASASRYRTYILYRGLYYYYFFYYIFFLIYIYIYSNNTR